MSTKECHECKALNEAERMVCQRCGASLDRSDNNEEGEEERKKPKQWKMLVAFAVMYLVISALLRSQGMLLGAIPVLLIYWIARALFKK